LYSSLHQNIRTILPAKRLWWTGELFKNNADCGLEKRE
jgi:hypothetical protein